MARTKRIKFFHAFGTIFAVFAAAFIVTSSLTDEWIFSPPLKKGSLFQPGAVELDTGFMYSPTYWGMRVKDVFNVTSDVRGEAPTQAIVKLDFTRRRQIYTNNPTDSGAWPSKFWYGSSILLAIAMLFTGVSIILGFAAICSEYNTSILASWFMWIVALVTTTVILVFVGGTNGFLEHRNWFVRRVFIQFYDELAKNGVILSSLPGVDTTFPVCVDNNGRTSAFNLGSTCK
eukprot:Ihof_evm2s172 gene=Ihof_evmTU2s172